MLIEQLHTHIRLTASCVSAGSSPAAAAAAAAATAVPVTAADDAVCIPAQHDEFEQFCAHAGVCCVYEPAVYVHEKPQQRWRRAVLQCVTR